MGIILPSPPPEAMSPSLLLLPPFCLSRRVFVLFYFITLGSYFC